MKPYTVEWHERGAKCVEHFSTLVGAKRYSRYLLHRGLFGRVKCDGIPSAAML